MPASSLKVAVVQAAPVLFDRAATLTKIEQLTRQAAEQGARLVLFPEAFVPAYPRGLSFGTVVGSRSPEGRSLWLKYWEEAVAIPGPALEQLAELARACQLWLCLGVIERGRPGGSLYCTLLFLNPAGELVGKHRKIKPTAAERIIWGEGDGSSLRTYATPWGQLGGLICWENYMPLARMALYQQGIALYLAPTADQREGWQASMRHIALEGRCFVLSCNQFVHRDMYPPDLPMREELAKQPDIMSRGGSVIVSPLGEVLAGPLWDREGMLLAELDLQELPKARLDFDLTGHYSRPDLFTFQAKGLSS